MKFGKIVQVLICLAALGILVENVLLAQQNRKLQEALAPQIAAGARMEAIEGLTLDGRLQSISLASSRSKLLLVTFSPNCPACKANQQAWMKLAAALRNKGLRVIWLSRDSVATTAEYCAKNGIPVGDTLAEPLHKSYVQFGLARVPNTMLVDASGRVEKVWAGRLDEPAWNAVFTYFGESQEKAAGMEAGARGSACGAGPSQPLKSCD